VIQTRRIKWVAFNTYGGEGHSRFWWGNLKERGHLGNLGVSGRIILKFTFKMWDGGAWTELTWLRIETGMEMNL
jgi:hypothetical protein